MVIKSLLEQFDEKIIRAFVQKNADYYLAKWKIMATSESKFSWNWASFLATTFWFGYRKMYIFAFIYILLNLLTIIPLIGFILWIVLWVGIGMFGNYFYGKYVFNKLIRLKLESSNEEEFIQKVLASGGVSIAGIFIVILMAITLVITLYIIFASLILTGYEYTNF